MIRSFRAILLASAAIALLLCSCERDAFITRIGDSVSFSVTGVGHSFTKGGDVPADYPEVTDSDFIISSGDTIWLMVREQPLSAARYGDIATKVKMFTQTELPDTVALGVTAVKYSSSNAEQSAWQAHTAVGGSVVARADYAAESVRTWVSSPRMLWPGNDKFVRFFTYAPFTDRDDDGTDDLVSVTNTGGSAPKIHYTVPSDDVSRQVDLLVSTPASFREYEGEPDFMHLEVPVTLRHALTGIRFQITNDYQINDIQLNNIYSSGSLDLSSDCEWTLGSDKASFSISPETTIDGIWRVTKDEYILMMLPQELPADAGVSVNLTTSTNDPVSLNLSLSGKTWRAGTLVTYTITKSNLLGTIDVTDENGISISNITLSGTESLETTLRKINIASFVQSNFGEIEPIPWQVEYSTDGGSSFSSSVDWVNVSDSDGVCTGGAGSQEGTSFDLTISPNRNDTDRATVSVNTGPDLISILRNAPEIGSPANPHDLSLHNIYGEPYGSQTSVSSITKAGHHTANCYIVSAPGCYCFPLVFGNAIDATAGDSNSENPTAYGSSITDGKTWFTDASQQKINSPYIIDGSADLSDFDAVAIWQDVERDYQVVFDEDIEVVSASSVGSSLNCPYIRFKIDRGSQTKVPPGLTGRDGYPKGSGILPCNIVIALRDKRKNSPSDFLNNDKPLILWSWHIWVTPVTRNYVSGQQDYNDFSVRDVKYRPTLPPLHTSYDTPKDVSFLNCNLGWTPPLYFYAGGKLEARSVVVRFTQPDTGASIEITVTQEELQPESNSGGEQYCGTYYQWGRKDPFLPGKALSESSSANRYFYSQEGYQIVSPDPASASTNLYAQGTADDRNIHMGKGLEIPLPHVMTGSVRGMHTHDLRNNNPPFWNILGTDFTLQSVVKTIYDPCPAGFCVPFYQAFSGFFSSSVLSAVPTSDTANPDRYLGVIWPSDPNSNLVESKVDMNGYGTRSPGKGWNLTDNADATGVKDFFIPFTGWRSNVREGQLSFDVGNDSAGEGPWTSGFHFNITAVNMENLDKGNMVMMMSLYDSSVYLKTNRITRGNPVRPILER